MWYANATPCANGSKLFEPYDYEAYSKVQSQFAGLSSGEKAQYRGAEHYATLKTGIELTPLNSNYRKMMEEITERLKSPATMETLPIDTVFQSDLIFNLLISLENEDHIKEVYKTKKLRVHKGLNTSEASVILQCFRQGRSLLQAGVKADLLAKPLIDFYAACAYAYAIIVINSPLHKSIDSLKGSHGHTYNHLDKTIDFGGNIPSGTFLDLLAALPVAHIAKNNIQINYSLVDSIDFIQSHSTKLSLDTLLSMVPELRDSYRRIDSDHKCTHKLRVDVEVVSGQINYNFYIGDGIDRPDRSKIEKCFKPSSISENQGSYKIVIPQQNMANIMPTIYQDVKGQLWYIESPVDGMVLPEFCLHYLTMSALCNIMRYSPHAWSDIISNKISSKYSLLISEYIHLFELKFPILVVQHITNYLPQLL